MGHSWGSGDRGRGLTARRNARRAAGGRGGQEEGRQLGGTPITSDWAGEGGGEGGSPLKHQLAPQREDGRTRGGRRTRGWGRTRLQLARGNDERQCGGHFPFLLLSFAWCRGRLGKVDRAFAPLNLANEHLQWKRGEVNLGR